MSFRFCTDKKDVAKNVCEVGSGALWWGIDLQERKKLQIPGGVPGGGMVTSKIEPCIIRRRISGWMDAGWMVNFMKYWVASLQ